MQAKEKLKLRQGLRLNQNCCWRKKKLNGMGLGGISKKEDGKVWVDANFLFSLSLYYFFLNLVFLSLRDSFLVVLLWSNCVVLNPLTLLVEHEVLFDENSGNCTPSKMAPCVCTRVWNINPLSLLCYFSNCFWFLASSNQSFIPQDFSIRFKTTCFTGGGFPLCDSGITFIVPID